jgi:hypothetical protein
MFVQILRSLVLVLGLAGIAWGQGAASQPPAVRRVNTDPSGACGSQALQYNQVLNKLWGCVASTWTVVVSGGAGAPADATYITKTANGTLSAEQAMGALATGIVKNTTGTGTQSIAVAGTDYASPTLTETWTKYTVTAIANGVNGCANANGCWQVNGVLGANKAASTAQTVVLFARPANGFISVGVIKSAVACTGTTTLTAGFSDSPSSTNIGLAATAYDLKGAVSDSNSEYVGLASAATGTAVTFVIGGDIGVDILATVENIDQIAAGCSFSLWFKSGVLP